MIESREYYQILNSIIFVPFMKRDGVYLREGEADELKPSLLVFKKPRTFLILP
jgi:hypothetical protein